ncbi:MAG: FAD-binding protein [Blastocatellia bacterium]|nr:FAD-binding protein [Blastocatellia bacterium]
MASWRRDYKKPVETMDVALKKVDDLCSSLNISVRRSQKMRNHTSIGIGGEIDCIAYPETVEAAAELVAGLNELEIRWSSLGAGSNLLVADDFIDRVAISLKLLEELLLFDGAQVKMHGGYRLSRLAKASAERGVSGLEVFADHPGTVGAAIARDDRRRGVKLISKVETLLVARNGVVKKVSPRECLAEDLKLVLGCTMKLKEEEDKQLLCKTVDRYQQKQMVKRSRYSVEPVFKPLRSRSVERLISEAGLRGFAVGEAAVASWNANTIVNSGNATTADFLKLVDRVKNEVFKKSGLEIELALSVWN